MSKNPPTKTKVTPPKPTEGSEQSHSVFSGENKQPFDRDITFATPDEGTAKTTPHPEGSRRDKDSGETNHPPIWNYKTLPMLISQGLEDKHTSSTAPHTEASDTNSSSDKILMKDQIDQLVEDSMSSLEKSSSTINDFYKGLEVITQLLKDITNSVKDDPAINKKIEEAFETLAKISTQTTQILSSVGSFDFSTLQSTVKNIQDHAFKQEETSASWMESSTNMAWNLGSRISGLERAQSHIKSTKAAKIAIPPGIIFVFARSSS
nr:hypothetical protein [Tanacetum cinerariifolium]